MKIVKYRAWDIKNKRMVPVLEINIEGGEIIYERGRSSECGCCPDEPDKWLNLKDVELMLYTGHLDETGQEMCEGDIFYIGENKDVLYKVIWYGAGFYYNELHRKDYRWTMPMPTPNARIITPMYVVGNIYKNR